MYAKLPQEGTLYRPEHPAGFLEAHADSQQDVVRVLVEGADCSGLVLDELECRQVLFRGCRFAGASFLRCGFTDAVFQSCDLSGCRLEDASMLRCDMVESKGMGTVLLHAALRQVSFQGCNLEYAQFDRAVLRRCQLSACVCRSSFWRGVTLKETQLQQVDFVQASLAQTQLDGVDLSACRIDGIQLSQSGQELHGAMVDTFQAAQLAKRLGVVIKDEM